MANEQLESLDERVRKLDTFLAKEIGKLIQRPYAEREDIENNLRPYTTMRNALITGYRAAFGRDLTDAFTSAPASPILPALEKLEFNAKIRHVFFRVHINTTEDLLRMSEHDLLRYKGLGQGSLEEIKTKLGEYNLCLSMVDQLS